MSQHDTLTLEPCPFCGGQPELEDCRTIWVVRCKCEACVLGKRAPEPDGSETDEYWQGIRQTAIDAWNRRAALSATQPAQAKQPEPAEHWHRLYLEKCQQYNDRVAQLGGVIEGLEAEAAQGAGEVAAWQASDGGSSYISNEARSRNSAFRELYTIPLYTQPAAGADVPPAQPAPVVPEGWEIREEATWVYFKRPDGFYQAVTPNDSHQSHAQTLHMLMRAMLAATPTPPAQAAADAVKAHAAVAELIEAADELKDVCNRPSAARTRAESWRRLDRAMARVRSS